MLKFQDKIEIDRIGRKFLTRISAVMSFRDRSSSDIMIALGTRSTIAIIHYETGKMVWENKELSTGLEGVCHLFFLKKLNAIFSHEGEKPILIFLSENYRIDRNLYDKQTKCGRNKMAVCNEEKPLVAINSGNRWQQGTVDFYDLSEATIDPDLCRNNKTVFHLKTVVENTYVKGIYCDPKLQPDIILIHTKYYLKSRSNYQKETLIVDVGSKKVLARLDFDVYSFTCDHLRTNMGVLSNEDGVISIFQFPEKNTKETHGTNFYKKLKADRMRGKYIPSKHVCDTDRFKVSFCYGGYIFGMNYRHFLIETSFVDEKRGTALWRYLSKNRRIEDRIESEGVCVLSHGEENNGMDTIFSINLVRQKITISRFENTMISMDRIDEKERIEFVKFSCDENEEFLENDTLSLFRISMFKTVPIFSYRSFLST